MAICGIKLNKVDILDAIKQNNGVINWIAAQMNCDRQTIYNWVERDKDVAQALKDAREIAMKQREDDDTELVALAYQSANHLLKERDPTFTIFTMKCKSKWNQDAGVEKANIPQMPPAPSMDVKKDS